MMADGEFPPDGAAAAADAATEAVAVAAASASAAVENSGESIGNSISTGGGTAEGVAVMTQSQATETAVESEANDRGNSNTCSADYGVGPPVAPEGDADAAGTLINGAGGDHGTGFGGATTSTGSHQNLSSIPPPAADATSYACTAGTTASVSGNDNDPSAPTTTMNMEQQLQQSNDAFSATYSDLIGGSDESNSGGGGDEVTEMTNGIVSHLHASEGSGLAQLTPHPTSTGTATQAAVDAKAPVHEPPDSDAAISQQQSRGVEQDGSKSSCADVAARDPNGMEQDGSKSSCADVAARDSNGENDGGGNDNEVNNDMEGDGGSTGSVVELFDSDDEQPTAPSASSATAPPPAARAAGQGEGGSIPLPPSPPPVPWSGNAPTSAVDSSIAAAKSSAAGSTAAEEAAAVTAAAAAVAVAQENDDSDSDIEIVGTTAAPSPPQPQHQLFQPVQPRPHHNAAAAAAIAARVANIPLWMQGAARHALENGLEVGSREYNQRLQAFCESRRQAAIAAKRQEVALQRRQHRRQQRQGQGQEQEQVGRSMTRFEEMQQEADRGKCNRGAAICITNSLGHVPTWAEPTPRPKPPTPQPQPQPQPTNFPRAFRLSLISCTEFTITAIPHPNYYDNRFVNLSGLRIHIKRIAREHGGATFDDTAGASEDASSGTPSKRWRIPLGAYISLYTWLTNEDRRTHVEGIPQRQLAIASLGQEMKGKAYPSANTLVSYGLPAGIAKALAPYQRGGVDFVRHREGRAFIGDEMGLGKTIQAVAAMSLYEREWPLIVFSPSSARYHWEVEFMHWLGEDSVVNKPPEDECGDEVYHDSKNETEVAAFAQKKDYADDNEAPETSSSSSSSPELLAAEAPVPAMRLLRKSHVNVLTSSKDPIFPKNETRVVICSYGLAPNLIASGVIQPGMFKCAIVDESHMLKNKNTKRTKAILPLLMATTRCILLSGTPALSRPMELWPQLSALSQKGWWDDEAEYVRKYVRSDGETADGGSLAELHTLLTSTVMIRRMKVDMLKNLPKKERHNAKIRIKDEELKREFAKSMQLLREGKGTLGELARQHKKEEDERKSAGGQNGEEEAGGHDNNMTNGNSAADRSNTLSESRTGEGTIDLETARAAANQQAQQEFEQVLHHCQQYITSNPGAIQGDVNQFFNGYLQSKRPEIEQRLRDRLSQLTVGGMYNGLRIIDQSEESTRKTILNHLYTLTGKAKVPIIVKMLNAWLDGPSSRGKLCIFAHHIDILDAISEGAGLSNASGSRRRFIRIDGSTNPKVRQEEMMKFQSDPTVRVAILGITAAGVAVTLTAASTVWFAELFWTPAIMIQAEDRCHRIGQQATVKCLYLIAKGTLDEVLWKLIEKKFRELGEFVEGKENLDIVVHRTFDCGMEAIQSDREDDEEEDSNDENSYGDGSEKKTFKRQKTSSFGELANEDSIQHDIEELAKEEEAMLNIGLDDDDDNADPSADNSSNNGAAAAALPSESLGTSRNETSSNVRQDEESAAICLIDDSDEEDDDTDKLKAVDEKNKPAQTTVSASIANFISRGGDYRSHKFHHQARFQNMTLYKMHFAGPLFGLVFASYQGRVVIKFAVKIKGNTPEQNALPCAGDILVNVNGAYVPHNTTVHNAVDFMTRQFALGRTPVELQFAHDPDFCAWFCDYVVPRVPSTENAVADTGTDSTAVAMPSVNGAAASSGGPAAAAASTSMAQSSGGSDEVIELLDDDD